MPLADDAVLESPSTAGATTASPALTSIIVHKVATSTVTNVGEAIMNASLRRYIKMLRLVFFDKKDHSDNVNPQVSIFKEVLNIYRLLSMEVHIQIENATWEVMLECILQLQFQVMCAPSNKYAIISIPSAADECVDFIMETLFHCWVRSQTKSDGLWLKLRQQLNKSTRWPQTVSQWGVT